MAYELYLNENVKNASCRITIMLLVKTTTKRVKGTYYKNYSKTMLPGSELRQLGIKDHVSCRETSSVCKNMYQTH